MPGTPPLYITAHSVAETAACVYEEVSAVLRHSGPDKTTVKNLSYI